MIAHEPAHALSRARGLYVSIFGEIQNVRLAMPERSGPVVRPKSMTAYSGYPAFLQVKAPL